MEDKEVVIINNRKYIYDEFYKRLELDDSELYEDAHVACPTCLSTTNFSISYGNYECIAICSCGHSMTIYDG